MFAFVLILNTNTVFSEPSIDLEVIDKLQTLGKSNVTVILGSEDLIFQESILSLLSESDFKLRAKSITGIGFSGEISKSGLEKLRLNSNVRSINPKRTGYISLSQSRPIIGTSDIWNLNYEGEGETVCILDTGIDTDHTAFKNKILDQHCYCTGIDLGAGGCCPDLSGEDDNAEDDHNHGTHVAGIAAGNGFRVKGVSKESDIVAVKVCNYAGGCEEIDVANGINWCVANYPDAVISISLGFGLYNNPSQCNALTEGIAVIDAYNSGTMVVVASGNDNSLTTISSPACSTGAISVGATYDDDVGSKSWSAGCTDSTTTEDKIVCFTNRDEILDVLAPGSVIKSAKRDSFFTLLEDSGTSMAAPHVSGAIALLKEADDTNSVTNSPMNVRELLKETGKIIKDDDTGLYIPRLDIFKAFQIDWPMYHHDLRRTGYTLLKGNLRKTDDSQVGWTIDEDIDSGFFDFPSIADIDPPKSTIPEATIPARQEILTSTSITQGGSSAKFEGRFYVLECDPFVNRCTSFTERWKFIKDDLSMGQAPSVDDINNDGIKEVVFAGFPNDDSNDGTVYAFRANERGNLNEKDARYKFDLPFESDQGAGTPGEIGHTAIADIDLDGKKEVLVADYFGTTNWQGFMYVLEAGSSRRFVESQPKVAIGPKERSGGAKGAIAIANIDSDDYPEIIVPNALGLYVYEYDGNNIVKKWNNSDAFIYHTAVVADVDADNEYEIVYLTHNDAGFSACTSGVTCTDKLHIVTAINGTEECSTTLTEHPNAAPAVGNLNADNNLEITFVTRNDLGAASGQSYGHIYTYNSNCVQQNSFPATNDIDTYHSAPDIFDIDNDASNDVIFAATNGSLYVLDNTLDLKWDPYDLGGEIASAPAIGDLDGDGRAEIAAKHLTGGASSMGRVLDSQSYKNYNFSQFSLLGTVDNVITIIEGNNTQPTLDEIDNVYGIEGDLINLTIISNDFDLDTLTNTFSSPLNDSGEWQTDENSSGIYEILTEVSDGNLTDSQFLTLTIFENGTKLENNFSDGTSSKELNFTTAESQTINLNLNRKIDLERAALKIKGSSLSTETNSFQEPNVSIIEANELNSTYSSNQSIDKDWNTYYSAGKATGEIVELENLTIPNNPKHMLFNLKLTVYGGGYGRFAIYNYNTDEYEIVTSSIPSFFDESKNITFDIYEDNPIALDNDTYFSKKVNNLNNYINNNRTRWYYRYLGDWASQKIYESEVKFESDLIYPTNLQLDVGNDGTDLTYDGELHSNYIKVDSLSNGNNNETISINNDSTTRYIKLPKNAELLKAEISIGDNTVETLELNEIKNLETGKIIPPEKGENFNTIKNLDETYTSTFTTEPINYLENNNYKSIDTNILPSLTGYDYEVTEGIYKAYFKDSEIKLEKDGIYLTFNLLNLTAQTPIINKNQIIYNISKDISLKYTYDKDRLKEDIILNKIPNIDEISFELNTNGVIENNNTIKIKKDNEIIANIENLYAYDSNNNRIKLNYQLNNNIFTIQLPTQWLQNAIYPVTIDPTTDFGASKRCTVEESPGDNPCSDINYPEHQSYNSGAKNERFLIQFDVTSIQYDEILSATLNMFCNGVTNPSSGNSDTQINNITHGWTTSVTWNTKPTSGLNLGSWYCSTSNTWHNLDITSNVVNEITSEGKLSYIGRSKVENSGTRRTTSYATNLNISINHNPNSNPVLVGCSDGYTTRNSDGLDINVDLWDCNYDDNDPANQTSFSILSESNSTLIDCHINSSRYVNCDAPDTNAIGFSDVVVETSDGQLTDNDTIRIYVRTEGNATVSINNTEVFFNNYYTPRDIDIRLEIENYLDVCENDSNGDCLVPIEIEGDEEMV